MLNSSSKTIFCLIRYTEGKYKVDYSYTFLSCCVIICLIATAYFWQIHISLLSIIVITTKFTFLNQSLIMLFFM